ncbi:hypothetical protein [Arthrobacter sp.]|uniref:hypothetical protein n=1 Tax=Arthrobacter sp. TaxID=1667 RepID=UPI002811D87E|nr:hypothetical protein [Arthrobacter sp.]
MRRTSKVDVCAGGYRLDGSIAGSGRVLEDGGGRDCTREAPAMLTFAETRMKDKR